MYSSADKHMYWFLSSGINGNVLKVVTIDEMEIENRFNIGLADFINEDLNYSHISGNNDLDIILGTIVKIALDFTSTFASCELFVTGNTPAKTRLYQIKVSNNLSAIKELFEVAGMNEDGNFVSFVKGEKYHGILLIKK